MPVTSGIINASIVAVYIGSNRIDLQTQCSIKFTMSPRESRTKDGGSFPTRFDGIRDWEITGEFEYAQDATTGLPALFTAWLNGTKLTVSFKTNNASDTVLSGEAYVTDINVRAGVEESAVISYTLSGSGAPTKS